MSNNDEFYRDAINLEQNIERGAFAARIYLWHENGEHDVVLVPFGVDPDIFNLRLLIGYHCVKNNIKTCVFVGVATVGSDNESAYQAWLRVEQTYDEKEKILTFRVFQSEGVGENNNCGEWYEVTDRLAEKVANNIFSRNVIPMMVDEVPEIPEVEERIKRLLHLYTMHQELLLKA